MEFRNTLLLSTAKICNHCEILFAKRAEVASVTVTFWELSRC